MVQEGGPWGLHWGMDNFAKTPVEWANYADLRPSLFWVLGHPCTEPTAAAVSRAAPALQPEPGRTGMSWSPGIGAGGSARP